MSQPTRSKAARRVGKLAGILLSVAFVLVGIGMLGMAVYMHFGVVSNFNEHSKPDEIWGSAFDEPLVLTEPYASYGLTSVRGPLRDCTIRGEDGSSVEVYRDEEITKRPAFRFDAPAGTYRVSCEPDNVYFEIYTGDKLTLAAQGYDGVHPSLIFLAGAAVTLPISGILWNRFVQRPRDWAYTPAE